MAEGRVYRGEFHIHSRYSYDGILEPEWIVKKASHLGMTVLSITDHETMDGSWEALDVSDRYQVEIWPGMEIATNAGDIIGLRLKSEIQARDWEEVVHEIRDKGGVVVLPHPFRGHKDVEKLAASADIIEVFNGRDSPKNIERAVDLARRHGKPGIAGSDAHVASEVGNAVNIFEDLLSFEKKFITKRSNRFEKTFSYLVKDAKKGCYGSVPRDLLSLIRG